MARRLTSMSFKIMGVRMSCMASSIFPPGATMMFGRDMNESWIMDSRYGKSMPLGSAKRMTTKLSSGAGM